MCDQQAMTLPTATRLRPNIVARKKHGKLPMTLGRATRGALKRRIDRFVAVYSVNFDPVEAAIACGYKPRSAKYRGNDMLNRPEVQEGIRAYQAKVRFTSGLKAAAVVQELARCGLYDIGRVFGEDGFLLPMAEIDPDTRSAIVAVEQEVRRVPGGDGKGEIVRTRVKFADKVSALVNLGKHFGIFEKDNVQQPINIIGAILASIDPGRVDLLPLTLPPAEGYAQDRPPACNAPLLNGKTQESGVGLLDRLGTPHPQLDAHRGGHARPREGFSGRHRVEVDE